MKDTREIAERLFDDPLPDNARYADFDVREWHISRMDVALRNERERAARIVLERKWMFDHEVAAAIRGESNAT